MNKKTLFIVSATSAFWFLIGAAFYHSAPDNFEDCVLDAIRTAPADARYVPTINRTCRAKFPGDASNTVDPPQEGNIFDQFD